MTAVKSNPIPSQAVLGHAGMRGIADPCFPSLWDPPQAGSALQRSGASKDPTKAP